MSPEPMSIDEYFIRHGASHVEKSRATLKPMHTPGDDPPAPCPELLRRPFEPQAHVIAAAVKMLDATKRGLLACEVGTGKTIMGMGTVHEHAARAARKGGSNGKYRALVLCPDHLISKWKKEILDTIPGATVVTFDDKGKGCKVLLGEFALVRGQERLGNRWRRPQGPSWYILGRDQAKFQPDWSSMGEERPCFDGTIRERGSTQPVLEKVEHPLTKEITSQVTRRYVCPRCGKAITGKSGSGIDVHRSSKQLRCEAKYLEDVDPLSPDQAVSTRDAQGKMNEFQDGQLLVSKGLKYRVRCCGEPLWQYTSEKMRWAPAEYVHSHMHGFFRYLVIDEVHETKSADAIQALACAKLMASSRHCLALTGTLIGGYANHLFPILFRMQARSMVAEGFRWGKQLAFIRKYGRIEKIVTTRNGKPSPPDERPAPGIMPGLFGRHLLDKAIFLSLEELAANLPPLTEYVGWDTDQDEPDPQDPWDCNTRVMMTEAQAEEYMRIEKILLDTNQNLLAEGNNTLLGAMLQCLLGYVDRPWEWGPVCFKMGELRIPAVEPIDLDPGLVYPKEQAWLDMVDRELAAGNQVWTYCQMTNTRDVQPRLKTLLEERGARVAVLRSKSVRPRDRLAWIDRMGKTVDVVLSHPQLVQTGIDFFNREKTHNFSSIAFFQTGYNSFHMRQASRRAWRIGQDRACRIYYFYYQGTAQEAAMKLMARKAAASLALDGRMTADGFAAMADDESAAMALARSISQAIKDDVGVRRQWTKVGGSLVVPQPRLELPAPCPPVATVARLSASQIAERDYLLDL